MLLCTCAPSSLVIAAGEGAGPPTQEPYSLGIRMKNFTCICWWTLEVVISDHGTASLAAALAYTVVDTGAVAPLTLLPVRCRAHTSGDS
jgi:hypothetical protein